MTDKTKHQVLRFLTKVADKFPAQEEPNVITDIHVQVSQDTGDIMAFDDDGKEITRCVVDEWINNQEDSETFYKNVEDTTRSLLQEKEWNMGIIKPYSFILENENGEHIAELFVVDDSETVILGSSFIENMEKDLDDFFDKLMKEE